jgi:hypothetical protein
LETLRKSIPSFPKDTLAPFSLSKGSTSLILRICDIHIYIKNGILGYVISIPLVNRGIFAVFRLIPLPIALDKDKFVYIETENQIMCIDQTRQYYFATTRDEINRCKSVKPGTYICKQKQPLLNSHMQESCMVKLLQPRINIRKICDTRVVQITHTVWTQLEKRNEWIYFIPSSDSITILCPEKEPIDVVLRNTGKLKIEAGCKGYSQTALLSTKNEIKVNTSRCGGDLLSKVESQFNCCEQLGISINLSNIDLDLKFKQVVTHMEL